MPAEFINLCNLPCLEIPNSQFKAGRGQKLRQRRSYLVEYVNPTEQRKFMLLNKNAPF